MDFNWILEIIRSPHILLFLLPLLGYFCWHNVYDYNDLPDVITAIGANEAGILIASQQDIDEDLTIPANVTLKFIQGGTLNIGEFSIRNATYQWTVSPAQAGEYYLELDGGGDPGLTNPLKVYEDDVLMTIGTLGSLAVGEWNYGNNDALGFDTIYVRIAGTVDPDTKAEDYVEAGYVVTFNGHVEAGLFQIFEGNGSVSFSAGSVIETYPEWWGADPTGTNDSYSAIAACAIASSVISLTKDAFYITSQNLPFGGKIINGNGATIKVAVDFPVAGTDIQKSVISADKNITIRHLRIYGDTMGDVKRAENCFYAINTDKVMLEEIYCAFSNQHGIWLAGNCWMSSFKDVRCDDLIDGAGFKVSESNNTTISWVNCYAANCKYGWHLNEISGFTMDACATDDIIDTAFYISASQGVQNGCYGERNLKLFYIAGAHANVILNSCNYLRFGSTEIGTPAPYIINNAKNLTLNNSVFISVGITPLYYTKFYIGQVGSYLRLYKNACSITNGGTDDGKTGSLLKLTNQIPAPYLILDEDFKSFAFTELAGDQNLTAVAGMETILWNDVFDWAGEFDDVNHHFRPLVRGLYKFTTHLVFDGGTIQAGDTLDVKLRSVNTATITLAQYVFGAQPSTVLDIVWFLEILPTDNDAIYMQIDTSRDIKLEADYSQFSVEKISGR